MNERSDPGVAKVQPPRTSPNGKAEVAVIYPTTAPQDAQTSALLHRLRHAVLSGEKDQLDVLIEKVMEQDAPFARALRDLADKYDYDGLIKLLVREEPVTPLQNI